MTEDSAPLPVASAAGTDQIHPDHLRKEAWTMALYVAICLIAALTALANVAAVPGHIMGLVWGTTVGLAVAHVFAFRIAGRLVHAGDLPRADHIISVVQLAAAAAVAVVVSVPVLLAPTVNEITWARYTCAAIIGWSAIWSPAARNAVGSSRRCSASGYWSRLSSSQRSNTRWQVISSLGQMAPPH